MATKRKTITLEEITEPKPFDPPGYQKAFMFIYCESDAHHGILMEHLEKLKYGFKLTRSSCRRTPTEQRELNIERQKWSEHISKEKKEKYNTPTVLYTDYSLAEGIYRGVTDHLGNIPRYTLVVDGKTYKKYMQKQKDKKENKELQTKYRFVF